MFRFPSFLFAYFLGRFAREAKFRSLEIHAIEWPSGKCSASL